MTGHSSQRNWIGFALAVIGGFGFLSFVFAATAMIPVSSPLWAFAVWGDLLFRSMHLAGLYVPAYLITLGLMLFNGTVRYRHVGYLTLGFVPAVTAGIAMGLMFSRETVTAPLPAALVSGLTLDGAVVVCASLALITLIALLQLPAYFDKQKKGMQDGAAPSPAGNAKGQHSNDTDAVTGSRTTHGNNAGPAENGESDEETDNLPQDHVATIHEFKSAMSGKLENRLRREGPRYTDVDAPLKRSERKQLWKDESDEQSPSPRVPQVAADALAQVQRPMFYSPDNDADDTYLEVYFGKDGNMSDYPPDNRRSWVTFAEEAADQDAAERDRTGHNAANAHGLGPVRDAEAPYAHLQRTPAQVSTGTIATGAESSYRTEGIPAKATAEGMTPDSPTTHHSGIETDSTVQAESVVSTGEGTGMTTVEPAADTAAPRTVSARSPGEYEAGPANIAVPEGAGNYEIADAESSEYSESEDEDADLSEHEPDPRLLPPLPVSMRSRMPDGQYSVPIKGVLDEHHNKEYWLIDAETTKAAATLKSTLEEFGIAAEVTGIRKGPVITMFEILPAPGVKLARIVNLSDNIALRLAAQSVRIVAPIPGKHAVGIEIPNRDRAVVSFAELLQAEGFSSPKVELPVALGKDITGDAQIVDLTRTPHLLIAGSTGSGKSVCVNALICSLLYRRSPAEVNMILIDPKIVELKFYNDIPHLLTPVITDPKKAFQALQWCLYEMERRYSLLDAVQVRDIKSYNKKVKAKSIATPHLPYLVIVIDEFADLMATSGKELEGTLARLAAMSRAVGIHLVLATQRPSTDVITGLIKANIPSRIAFMVASKIDSRIIIDSMGAEKLLGKGDMLFTSAWDPFPFRMQGAFLSEEEVERIVSHVKTLGKPDYIDDEIFFEDEDEADSAEDYEGGEDPLMKEAIDIVVSAKKASASYLQRRLKIGYNRAARLVEEMEEMGIVGPQNGSKAREILRMFQ